MIVADASVLVPALVDDGSAGALARERLLGSDVHAPELVDVEVFSVVRREVLGGRITRQRGTAALEDYAELALERHPTCCCWHGRGSSGTRSAPTTRSTWRSPSCWTSRW